MNQRLQFDVNRRHVTVVAILAVAGLCAVAYATLVPARSAATSNPPVSLAPAPGGDFGASDADSRSGAKTGSSVRQFDGSKSTNS